jgi:Icc-related predicted phosphoesterase
MCELGPGLPSLLFVVFLVLKLTGFIAWSWWWVTAPLWLPTFLVLSFMGILPFYGSDHRPVKMKIAFISDSHRQCPELPDADLLVHCGDLTGLGTLYEFQQQVEWLRSVKERYPLGIIYVPGNHDCGLDPMSEPDVQEREEIHALFRYANIKVLINRAITIEGIKFYGSPMTPTFFDWAFMGSENELADCWERIPEDTQILITHGPAQGLRDLCRNGHVGSSSLRWHVDNHLPNLKLHAFGHIHEGAGCNQEGRYLCLNASVLDGWYNGFNPVHVVDTETWTYETHEA